MPIVIQHIGDHASVNSQRSSRVLQIMVVALGLCVLISIPIVYTKIVDYLRQTDFSPLIPCEQLANNLKSKDYKVLIGAVYQLGRHGKNAQVYMPDLKATYMRISDDEDLWDDPILGKSMRSCLAKISGSYAKADSLAEDWRDNWIQNHRNLAKERGLLKPQS
jgi:hypothetical protein